MCVFNGAIQSRIAVNRLDQEVVQALAILSVLYLYPKDDAETLLRHFKRKRILERAASKPGCLAAEFHVPLQAGEPVLVTALWESANAYQAWVEDPWRQAAAWRLNELLDQQFVGTSPGLLYSIAHAVVNGSKNETGGA